MRKLLLLLSVAFPLASHGAPFTKLSYGEYSTELDRLGATCVAKNMPKFNGMCLSKRYDASTDTALSVSLALHRFGLFLQRCEVPEPNGWSAARNGVFKINSVKGFYEEMAPQTEALDVYARYSIECKSAVENEAEAAKGLQWFAHMTAKYSDEGKHMAAQAEKEQRRQRSLAEHGQWETDAWFVGRFSGRMSMDKTSADWSLVCAMGEECALTMRRPGLPAEEFPMRVPVRREISIPNNNLKGTRAVARARPDWYQDPREGPLLLPLRAWLNSQEGFERCVDIGAETDLALCSLTSDPRASKSVVLLLGTMKASCGESPFCAYYFQILNREKGR